MMTLELVINHMSDMVFVMSVDEHGVFRYKRMNSAAMKGSGLNTYAYGATFQDVVHPDEARVLNAYYQQAVQQQRPVSFILNHEGQVGETMLNAVVGDNGRISHVVGIVRDITARFQEEERFREQALHDSLTGLLNRRGLDQKLDTAFQQARATAAATCLLMIDVDALKFVNDGYGHVIGDLYLQDVALRIRSAVRTEDSVVRFGGDEFLVIANVAQKADVVILADRILHVLSQPWLHEQLALKMSVSIGIAAYPIHGVKAMEVIQAADHALYEAKHQGGDRYTFADLSFSSAGWSD